MAGTAQTSVVLIDDKEAPLHEFEHALNEYLASENVVVRIWRPSNGEDPRETFDELVDANTILVVTDYDLTRAGLTGLFGVSIVSWCQSRFIPVGNFSRGNVDNLPREPNLFELRVPTDIPEAAGYTATMYRGFKDVRDKLRNGAAEANGADSPAQALAEVIGRRPLEGQIALYMSLLGAANASLLDSLRGVPSPNREVPKADKVSLLSYVVGHVLANAVLRYPGPILSEQALCAYLATTGAEGVNVETIFNSAKYTGPFSTGRNFYWRSDVDAIITNYASAIGDASFETSGEFNRAVVENILDRPLEDHECRRCSGSKGGYLCPFTERPVCERGDCSVAANSWIPSGADVCRVERDFYDEWAPLLGL
jgi:hypothetical protein